MRLSEIEKDALQELGNIGAAHAATTLSQLLDSPVRIGVPDVTAVDIARLSEYLGEDPAPMVVFELTAERPQSGYIICHLSHVSAIGIANAMLGINGPDRPLTDMDKSTLCEMGKIMVSAYLNATAELLGFAMLPSPPALVIDMPHAAVQSLIARMHEEPDEVLLFGTELTCAEHKIESDIILMPEISSLKTIVALLEKMVNSAP